jgi:phage regulator Rha-like protein
MEENTQVTLEQVQSDLLAQFYEERTPEQDQAYCDQFDRVSKALAEQRKAENERARIEMEEAKSVRDAEAADRRSKRELIGNGLKTAGQVGAALVAGFVSIVSVARIINAEDHDKLVLSKAIGFVLKPRG